MPKDSSPTFESLFPTGCKIFTAFQESSMPGFLLHDTIPQARVIHLEDNSIALVFDENRKLLRIINLDHIVLIAPLETAEPNANN